MLDGSTSSRRTRLLILWILVAVTAYCPWGLWEPDEGRYADVAGQMLARGDLITPRIDGAVFVDKPPLVYWVTAGCLAALGRNEAAARMGQILFAAGTLFVVYRIGLLLVSRRDAGFAVIILASSAGFFAGGHILTLDLALTFFVALTLLGFLRWYHAGGAGWRWQVVMFAGAAGGVLAKGLIGVVLPALVIASFLTIRREWPRAREIRWVRCGLLFLAIAAPWHVAVAAANPGFLHHYFVQEHLARLATSYHHRPGGWGYYPLVLAAALIPWSLILPAHLVRSRPSLRGLSATLRAEASAFFLSWLLPGLIFLTIARSKLPLYILPLFPAAALSIASVLCRDLERRGAPRPAHLWPSLLLIGAGVGAAVVWLRRNAWHLSAFDGRGAALLYVVLALALAALAAGYLIARRGRHALGILLVASIWMISGQMAFAIASQTSFLNETKRFASILREQRRAGEPVYAYKCYLRGLPFYLDETVGLISPASDDLRFGAQAGQPPETFPSVNSFLERLGGDGKVFVVVKHGDLRPLQRKAARPLLILARSERFNLVTNRLGETQLAQLGALFGNDAIDLDSIARTVERLAPGAAVDLAEISDRGGEPFLTLHLSQEGARRAATIPMRRPDQATISPDIAVAEEAIPEGRLLRIAPQSKSLSALAELLQGGSWGRKPRADR